MEEPNATPALKILTLDGGGLQALATLSSLNAVCRAVAKQNGADRPPAPHELFDIIGGIGTGGWIALLLGRYRLDIATCTSIYMELASKVDVEKSDPNSVRRDRLFKLDQTRLISVVEETLQRYGLDPRLLVEEGGGEENDHLSRCKYAFAAGVIPQEIDQPAAYELFRSYSVNRTQSGVQHVLRPGPCPEKCGVPEVFAATGAAKFFLKPFQIDKTTFFDDTFPHAHPISSIALDEATALYGSQLEISVLLNVGPGIPSDNDCQELDLMCQGTMSRLSRKFSWPSGRRLSFRSKDPYTSSSSGQDSAEKGSRLTSASETALRLESQRREDIRARLEQMYGPSGAAKYHHLGPEYSADRASLNDVYAIGLAQSDFKELKNQSVVEAESVVREIWVRAAA